MEIEEKVRQLLDIIAQNQGQQILLVQRQEVTVGRNGCMGGSESKMIIGGRDVLAVVNSPAQFNAEKKTLYFPVELFAQKQTHNSRSWGLEKGPIELNETEINDFGEWKSDNWRFGVYWCDEKYLWDDHPRDPKYTLRILAGKEISLFFNMNEYAALWHNDFLGRIKSGKVLKKDIPKFEKENSEYNLAQIILGIKALSKGEYSHEIQIKKEEVLEKLLLHDYLLKHTRDIEPWQEESVKLSLREALALEMDKSEGQYRIANKVPSSVSSFVKELCKKYAVK